MSDQPDDTTPPDDGDDRTFPADVVRELRGEAASYRTRARELEQRVEELQAQVDEFRRREVDRAIQEAATDRLADPDDLIVHVNRDTLVTDDGNPNPEAIESAISELLDAKPHLSARRITGGADGGQRGAPATSPPTFGDVLRRGAGG